MQIYGRTLALSLGAFWFSLGTTNSGCPENSPEIYAILSIKVADNAKLADIGTSSDDDLPICLKKIGPPTLCLGADWCALGPT